MPDVSGAKATRVFQVDHIDVANWPAQEPADELTARRESGLEVSLSIDDPADLAQQPKLGLRTLKIAVRMLVDLEHGVYGARELRKLADLGPDLGTRARLERRPSPDHLREICERIEGQAQERAVNCERRRPYDSKREQAG